MAAHGGARAIDVSGRELEDRLRHEHVAQRIEYRVDLVQRRPQARTIGLRRPHADEHAGRIGSPSFEQRQPVDHVTRAPGFGAGRGGIRRVDRCEATQRQDVAAERVGVPQGALDPVPQQRCERLVTGEAVEDPLGLADPTRRDRQIEGFVVAGVPPGAQDGGGGRMRERGRVDVAEALDRPGSVGPQIFDPAEAADVGAGRSDGAMVGESPRSK